MKYIFLIPSHIEYSYIYYLINKYYPSLLLSNKIEIVLTGCGLKAINFLEKNINILNKNKIILTGTAGSLTNSLYFGNAISPDKLITDKYNEPITLSPLKIFNHSIKKVTIYTSKSLISSIEKKQYINNLYSAHAVDMESYYIAKEFIKYNLNLKIIKIILDEYNDTLIKRKNNYFLFSSNEKDFIKAKELFSMRLMEACKIIVSIINLICK